MKSLLQLLLQLFFASLAALLQAFGVTGVAPLGETVLVTLLTGFLAGLVAQSL